MLRPRLLLLACFVFHHSLWGYLLFWTDDTDGTVSRYDTSDDSVTTIVSSLTSPAGVDVDEVNSRIFFGHNAGFSRTSFDGSNRVNFGGSQTPYGVKLDDTPTYLYFANSFNSVKRIRISDSSLETLFTSNANGVSDVAIDDSGDLLYWVSRNTGEVARGDETGSGSPTVLFDRPTDTVNFVEIDVAAGLIFWTEASGSEIYKANLDGTGTPAVIRDLGAGAQTAGLALVTADEVVFVADSANGNIYRMDYNGNNINTVVTGLSEPTGLAYIPESEYYAVLIGLVALGVVIARRRFSEGR